MKLSSSLFLNISYPELIKEIAHSPIHHKVTIRIWLHETFLFYTQDMKFLGKVIKIISSKVQYEDFFFFRFGQKLNPNDK